MEKGYICLDTVIRHTVRILPSYRNNDRLDRRDRRCAVLMHKLDRGFEDEDWRRGIQVVSAKMMDQQPEEKD